MKNNIEKWTTLTEKIIKQFLYDYFDDVDPDYFWVGGDVGGVFNYGDYFFGFDTVLTCYKLGITEEQLLNWYYFCLENHSVNISLARYILSPQERKEQEEKHLEELRNRVKLAEETFKEALKRYESNNTH
jgi:hypothetical protein